MSVRYPGFKKTIGSKAEVMHGTAHHTAGGLQKGDMKRSASGKYVSKAQSAAGVKAMARLKRSGKLAPPFTSNRHSRKSRKSRKSHMS